MGKLLQIMLRRMDDAPLLGGMHTGRRPAVGLPRAQAHFHKNQRAIVCAHNGVDFSAAPARGFVIALQQRQALLL